LRDVKIEAAEDRLNLRASRIKQLKTQLAESRATASRLEKANKERIRQLEDDKNALENEKKTLEHDKKTLEHDKKTLKDDKKTLEEDKMALEDQLSKSEAQNLVLKRKWEKGIVSLRTVLERDFSGKDTCY
jgi:colicin import membrane protein